MNTQDIRTRSDRRTGPRGPENPGTASAPAPAAPVPSTPAGHGRTTGLDELVIPALLVMIGGYLAFGLGTMEIPESAAWPGPDFFPLIVTVIIFIIAAVMSVQIVLAHRRSRSHARGGARTDWKATGTVVAAFLVFGALLLPLGWILAGALLFWGVARGLGSRRPVFDLLLSLGVSSLIQLAFSAGLGLRLPPGIFGWF